MGKNIILIDALGISKNRREKLKLNKILTLENLLELSEKDLYNIFGVKSHKSVHNTLEIIKSLVKKESL
jgi:methyl coenzyme M reductase gamma subunit